MKDTINLYTTISCPKCKILVNECKNNDKIKDSDFKIITINTDNKYDTDLQLLLEHNITSLPVLLINNQFLNFNEAMTWLRN